MTAPLDHQPPIGLRVIRPMRNETAAALRAWVERRALALEARKEKEAKE